VGLEPLPRKWRKLRSRDGEITRILEHEDKDEDEYEDEHEHEYEYEEDQGQVLESGASVLRAVCGTGSNMGRFGASSLVQFE
jgi:hypothetical protein